MSRVLVVSPHPDDEAVGCGGSLRRHAASGDQVEVVFLTSGEAGGHGVRPEVIRRRREEEARASATILGIDRIEFWRGADGALRADRALVARLCERIRRLRPAIVYAPHEGEDHADHRAAGRAVRLAAGALATRPEVRLFEVWTPLRRLDEVTDITPFIETKLAAIRAHASQCEVMDFAAAFHGLARYRGEMHCWPEGEYAEAFQVLPASRSRRR